MTGNNPSLVPVEESEGVSLNVSSNKPEITEPGHEAHQSVIETEGRFFLVSEDSMRRWVTQLSATEVTKNDIDKLNSQNTKIWSLKSPEFHQLSTTQSHPEKTGTKIAPAVVPCQDPHVPLTKDPKYYLETAIFEVEDRSFMVPKHHFLGSTIFKGLNTIDNAIKLTGVSKADFHILLKLMYPLQIKPKNTELTQNEWKSILRMATKWKILAIRRMAIENILVANMSPLEKVVIGRESKLPDLLQSGYADLAMQKDALSVEDFQILGLETGLKLSQKIRQGSMNNPSTWNRVSESAQLDQKIKATFQADIHEQAVSTDTVDRILLAQQYGISEWMFAGYSELVRRPEHISLDESRKLGLERTVKTCQVRESSRTRSSSGFGHVAVPTRAQVEKSISEVFADEMNEIQAASKVFGGSTVFGDSMGCKPLGLSVSRVSSWEPLSPFRTQRKRKR